jgi:hypothetical protein
MILPNKYSIYFIILAFLSLLSFLLMPFHDDLVFFGISFLAETYGGLDFLNNSLNGRLIGFKYIYYFFHYLSSNFKENNYFYSIIFRIYYAIFLIISGYIYSSLFCSYKNKIKKKNYNQNTVFFIFIFIFFLSPPSMSMSPEEIAVIISLLAYVFFLSKKNILIFLSGLFIGLTFFLKAVTICIGIATFFFIINELKKEKYFQEKKVIFLFLSGGLFSLIIFLIWINLFHNDFLNFYAWSNSSQFNKDFLSIITVFLTGLFTLFRHYPLITVINFLFILEVFLKFNKFKLWSFFLSLSPIIILAISQFIQVKSHATQYTGYLLITILFLSNHANISKIKNFIFLIPVLFFILAQQTMTIYFDPFKILGNYPNALTVKKIRGNIEYEYSNFFEYFNKNSNKNIKTATCLYLDPYASYYLKCKSENYFIFYLGPNTNNKEYNEKSKIALQNTKADIIIVNNNWCPSCKNLEFLDKSISNQYKKYPVTITGPDGDKTNLFIKN